MRPLMYALIRTAMVSGGIEQCERHLCRYAREAGFELAAVFRESGDGGAFEELLCELFRSQACYVVVPTLDHLCGLPVPRRTLLARLIALDALAWPLPGPPE
ncbi:hypothetical protein KO481_27845 [Nocardia sp. NEAU-G5]|uniref:Resolvase/invertase-type recombinase catalytic domain-containing protein n=1 Tax=Nocardia albiluteola TaxID=2842303 RepID=A0ABS6B4T8_9NOCA|nr:hypothetical protein [Nocardia albiluteola]MBU3065328.1 hypothetical protein [Nocardia albiluteola]